MAAHRLRGCLPWPKLAQALRAFPCYNSLQIICFRVFCNTLFPCPLTGTNQLLIDVLQHPLSLPPDGDKPSTYRHFCNNLFPCYNNLHINCFLSAFGSAATSPLSRQRTGGCRRIIMGQSYSYGSIATLVLTLLTF